STSKARVSPESCPKEPTLGTTNQIAAPEVSVQQLRSPQSLPFRAKVTSARNFSISAEMDNSTFSDSQELLTDSLSVQTTKHGNDSGRSFRSQISIGITPTYAWSILPVMVTPMFF